MTDYLGVKMTDEDIHRISSLGLAHIGDAVFELLVRTHLCLGGGETATKLHSAAVKMVNARAQAAYAELIMEGLSEEEKTVFKRGRNTRVNSVPKNAEVSDYHAATGLECLFGYLYLKNRTERINELFSLILSAKKG
jgi:ribonuclease-3 family protein